jgi:5-methylcytosine-specific restriction endonuclease McrA
MSDKHPFSTRRGRALREHSYAVSRGASCVLAEGRVAEAKTVDHIVRLTDGGTPFDPENLRSLCIDCHKQRHGARPRVRVDARTGLPIGDHWWNT